MEVHMYIHEIMKFYSLTFNMFSNRFRKIVRSQSSEMKIPPWNDFFILKHDDERSKTERHRN